MDLEFQISEVFPSLIIKKDLGDYITDEVKLRVDNIVGNMSTKIPLSEAFSSRNEINDVLDLSNFEGLRDHILESIVKYTIGQYQLNRLTIVESFIIHVPKDGYFELRKNLGSTFHLLINLSDTTEIVLQNPIYSLKSLEYDVDVPNKYNSQYSLSEFKENESMLIPSGIYYGFPKREKELKFLTVVLR